MSTTVAWAHGVVVDWTLHITRDLPPRVGEDRFAQIVSDLWEQEHAVRRRGPALAASLLLRLIRGVPADLAWRRSVLAETPIAPRTATAWMPILDGRPFDQTNGAMTADGGAAEIATDDGLWRSVAANLASGQFSGTGGGI